MTIENLGTDLNQPMAPPRTLFKITREDGKSAYVWVNSGCQLLTEYLVFEDQPLKPAFSDQNKFWWPL